MADPEFPDPYPRMVRPTHREKDMEVLALGMSRTGTMSLYVALKKLGYSCYHMAECGLDTKNQSMVYWHEAIDAKYNNKGRKYVGEDFDKMLWRYNAVTDIPCILFVDELLDAYPEAKVIITSREVEGWIASIEHSFYEILSWKRWPLLQFLDREHVHHYIPILRSALNQWTPGGNWDDRSKLAAGYAAHYEHVRKAVAKADRKVLEFRAQDGWEPLCGFLEKDIPNEPYPRVNEGNWVVGLHYFIFWIRLLLATISALTWLVPLLIAGLAYFWFLWWVT